MPAQLSMTLHHSTLPDVAIVTVDCASEQFVSYFLLDVTCENFILIFALINKLLTFSGYFSNTPLMFRFTQVTIGAGAKGG